GISEHCPGWRNLWRLGSADHRRELWQHSRPTLLCERARRYRRVRLAPHWQARSRVEARSHSRGLGIVGALTTTTSEQRYTEDAVMASEIEQLPDLTGFLKLASGAHWQRVSLKR